jgi:acid stress chaperone HdeB
MRRPTGIRRQILGILSRDKGNTVINKGFVGAALLAAAFSAQAASFDVKELTCEELLAAPEEEMGIMLFWLDGYLSGVTGDTTFDDENLAGFAEKMGAACAKSPESKALDTAKIVGIE